MIAFDEIRARYPHLGFALYAYEPGGPVTLECLTRDGKTFKFRGDTAAAAMAEGFADDLPTVAALPPVQEPSADPTTTDTSVFD